MTKKQLLEVVIGAIVGLLAGIFIDFNKLGNGYLPLHMILLFVYLYAVIYIHEAGHVIATALVKLPAKIVFIGNGRVINK